MNAASDAESRCSPLREQQRRSLAKYVQVKYGISRELYLSEAQAQDGCYWRVRFKTSDTNQPVSDPFFLTPDFRYLTRELLDTSVDLRHAAAIEAERMTAALSKVRRHSIGDEGAPVHIVVFEDFDCPFCKEQAKLIRDDILKNARRPVQITIRNLPLPSHPWAMRAAEAAACAGMQSNDVFWHLHDFIFDHQAELSVHNLEGILSSRLASSVNVDQQVYKRCMGEGLARREIEEDVAVARAHGVVATPTLFVNGYRFEGVATSSAIFSFLDSILASKSEANK